jgi:hypothetical protein
MRDRKRIHCKKCGQAYSATAWSLLPIVESVSASEVRTIVRGWPDGTSVQVRRCRRCRESIPAMVTSAPAASGGDGAGSALKPRLQLVR